MIQTEREIRLEELRKYLERKRPSPEHGGLYTPGKPKDDERFGFPDELWLIME